MSVLVLGSWLHWFSYGSYVAADHRDVVVVDNLLTGHRASVPEVPFYEVDIRDKAALTEVFEKENIEQVVHFAASSIVPESVEKPLKYFDNNVYGMINLLEVMLDFDVKQIVFSSTAATYGVAKENPIKETTPQNPINPYGESKLQMEHIMKWADQAYGLKWVALRYFNVAGAKADGSIGEDHPTETHLVPIILQTALGQREKIMMFGDDYNTPDGFNVRDYVHVMDLADAHVLALDYLAKGNESNQFNLGPMASVKQMVEQRVKQLVNHPAEVARRAGDPDSLVASSDKAREVLGWDPNCDDERNY